MAVQFRKKTLRLIEFLIIGVLFGLIEDLIAVRAASDAPINFQTVGIVLLVALPFAVISELVVDHPRFWTALKLRRDENGAAHQKSASGIKR